MNNYDEIRAIVEASRRALQKQNVNEINQIKKSQGLLKEEDEKIQIDKFSEEDVEQNGEQDETRSFKIQGSIISIHGSKKSELQLTLDEKNAFKESMDEFRAEISEIVDFKPLNIYSNKVQWSGTIPDKEINFHFSTDENNGVYMDAQMLKLDDEIVDLIEKLQKFFEKFKLKWNKILGTRKETDK